MKVGCITFHFVNNFGGALQAYALQRTITEAVCQEKGVCEIIDYHNGFIRFTDTVRLFPITTNVNEFISGIKTMRKRFGRIKRFRKFTADNCMLSDFYGSRLKMRIFPPKYDKYVCGSDQIWNPIITMGISPCYFLRFVKNPEDKVAYAPSFGSENISALWKNKVKRYLSSFGHLSVREKSGKELIKNLTGREAVQLIDPSFLLTKQEWAEMGSNTHIRGKYILLYIMQRDEKMYEYARKLKERLGVKLVEISRYGYQPNFVDTTLIDIGPNEFLGLFRDAEYICTNSYHGLIFSIIFEKEFCLIPCDRFRTRINNLLEFLQIQTDGREAAENPLTASYDKAYVDRVIKAEREKAISYLQECIWE